MLLQPKNITFVKRIRQSPLKPLFNEYSEESTKIQSNTRVTKI